MPLQAKEPQRLPASRRKLGERSGVHPPRAPRSQPRRHLAPRRPASRTRHGERRCLSRRPPEPATAATGTSAREVRHHHRHLPQDGGAEAGRPAPRPPPSVLSEGCCPRGTGEAGLWSAQEMLGESRLAPALAATDSLPGSPSTPRRQTPVPRTVPVV